MKFNVINISKFSYIYNENEKFEKKKKIIIKNRYKLRLKNKIFSQLETKIIFH